MNLDERAEEAREALREPLEEGGRHVCPVSRLRTGEEGVVAYLKTHDANTDPETHGHGRAAGNPDPDRPDLPVVRLHCGFTVGYSQFAVDAGMAAI